MEIVIDISKKLYTDIKDSWSITLGSKNTDKVIKAIKNGTPLPENHGRLISEEDMLSVIMFSKLFDGAKVGEVKETLLNIPTIIEADTESEDEE